MSISLSREQRAALIKAQATVRELLKPEREARKIAQAKARAQRERQREQRVTQERVKPKGGRERDPGYLAFLRRLPCIAGVMGSSECQGATQAAHLRFSDAKAGRTNPGMGAKPHDRHATPLCAHHHLRDQHVRQEQAFWNDLGIDPGDLSAALYAAYLAGEDGLAVLRRFAPRKETA